jgi:hypothetical protein
MTLSTSAVAVSRFSESFSSRVSRTSSTPRPPGDRVRRDTALGALLPFSFTALLSRALAGLSPALERFFIASTRGWERGTS